MKHRSLIITVGVIVVCYVMLFVFSQEQTLNASLDMPESSQGHVTIEKEVRKTDEIGSAIKHTPVRIGTKGIAHASLAKGYDLNEAVYDSDLVADITISSWLNEETNEGKAITTFFKATVNTVFKGEFLDEIVLLQEGNSDFTFNDYPLFQVGDRLLVFLKKTIPSGFEVAYTDIEYYENSYWIIGSYTTVMDVHPVDDDYYIVDRFGVLTEEISERLNEGIMQNRSNRDISRNFTKVNDKTSESFMEELKSSDQILYDSIHKRGVIFNYDEMTAALEELSGTKAASGQISSMNELEAMERGDIR